MAGMKGRSGGARPGSGPKKRPPDVVDVADALEFLRGVMSGVIVPTIPQLDAAKTIARYTHALPGAGNKKDDALDKAKKASTGKFAAAAPPLKLVGRK